MVATPQASKWNQVARLRPQLRQHVSTYPQEYRGERWYVLRDEAKGRHLRFNAMAYEFIGRLDGMLSVQQIWDELHGQGQAPELTQEDVLLILSQLFAIDALRNELPVDTQTFFKRYQQERQMTLQRMALNPLAIRIPLLDPDGVLNRLSGWIRPLFSWGMGLVWLLLVGLAGLLALANFPALVAAVNRDILAADNLALMLLVFVLIKTVHEFAHAFAVKLWGGEVHEMGVTLLVFAPVPYVDASAAWGFRDKRKRILVSSAGILAELLLAALALLVWLAVEPGMVKDLAFNALLIASVSTLLFNANPLLRFDGYYVLQDLVEIPNLATRASRYYIYLVQRYLLGIQQARTPVTAKGERAWFLFYGVAAFFYGLAITFAIVLFLAEEYLVAGILLGAWVLFMRIAWPLLRGLGFLLTSPQLNRRRWRAALVTVLLLSLAAGGLFSVPVPVTSQTEGVVWVPDQAQVFTETDGFVSQVMVPSGSEVSAGQLLVRLHSPALEGRLAILDARYRELEVRLAAERLKQRVQSRITAEEMATVADEIAALRQQLAAQAVYSDVAGTFVVPGELPLLGSYLRKGQLIGYVIAPERLIVRTVVPQSAIGLVRDQVDTVEVRLAEQLGRTLPASVLREAPAASADLPSRALGAAGGGEIAVRGAGDDSQTAVEAMFRLDLALPADVVVAGVGERAYVRFVHGSQPLARQWWRSARQLLLSRLAV